MLNGVCGEMPFERNETLGDLLFAEYPPGTGKKELQQRPLARRQIDRSVIYREASVGHVRIHSPDRQLRRGGIQAARHRSYSCLKFFNKKRLCRVVIGPKIKTMHPILNRVSRR